MTEKRSLHSDECPGCDHIPFIKKDYDDYGSEILV